MVGFGVRVWVEGHIALSSLICLLHRPYERLQHFLTAESTLWFIPSILVISYSNTTDWNVLPFYYLSVQLK